MPAPITAAAAAVVLEDHTPINFVAQVAREWGGFQPPPAFP